jgi:hypothetical protein
MWRILVTVSCVIVFDALLLFLCVGAAFNYECTQIMRWTDVTQLGPTPENLQAFDRARVATLVAQDRANKLFGGLMLVVTAAGFFVAGRQSIRRRRGRISLPPGQAMSNT